MNDKEMLWKEIDKDLDLYKFYLDIIIKSAIFVFGITGGIVSYYFANATKPLIVFSLIFPIILNIGFFVICFSSIRFAEILKNDHNRICTEAGIKIPYEMTPLPNTLRLFSFMYGACTFGMLILLIIEIFK